MVFTLKKETTPANPLMSFKEDAPGVSAEYTGHQAAKMHIALGESSPGVERISNSLSTTGDARQYKQLIAERDFLERQETKNQLLSEIVSNNPEITPEIVDVVQGLSMEDMRRTDLDALLEERYARIYTDTATASLDNDVYEDANTEDPEATLDMIDRADRAAFKNNYALTKMAQLQKDNADRGFLEKAWDFSERLVPFVEWYQKHDAIGSELNLGWLPGENLENQFTYMWSLPPEEFKSTFDRAVAELKDRNLYVAMSWVEGLMSYGSLDKVLDDAIGVADVASVVPLKTLGTALKGVVKGSRKNPEKLHSISTDLGKYEEAAIGKNYEDLTNNEFFGQNIRNIEDLENSIPSITSPLKMLRGSGNIPQAAYLRIKDALINRSERIRQLVSDPNLVDRLTPVEFTKLVDDTMVRFESEFPNVNKNVIDVSTSDATDIGNVYGVKVTLGRRDGSLFQSEKQAQNYVRRYITPKTDDYDIVQNGQGWQIEIRKNLDESRLLSDLEIPLEQQTPAGKTAMVGWWRSPDYTLSKQNVEARGVAVHSMESMARVLDEISQPIANLGKKEFRELEEILIHNRTQQTFFDNYGDFELEFFSKFKKNPTPEQTDAYFTYVQMNDLDLTIRDLNWYAQKARLGIEQITTRIGKDDVSFEGKVIDSLPYGSKSPFRVAVIEDGVPGKVKSSRFLNEADRERFQKLLDKDYKIIQVADQKLDLGDKKYAGFIITDSVKRNRVGVKNVDRKPGGHKQHLYPHYLKQGRIRENQGINYYDGDVTLFNVRTTKEGRELEELFNTARMKLLNREPDAVKYIRDNLPITPREFIAAYKAGKIDLNVPITLTSRGQRTFDTGMYSYLDNLEDAARNEHNLASRITGRYAGERGSNDIDIIQSESNTQFEVETAPYLSPMDTLRASTVDMINTRVLNDYVDMTNRNYIREFGDILDGTREEILSSGLSYLYNPKFKSGAAPERIAAARSVSRGLKNLLNHGSEIDRRINSFKDSLIESVIPRLGPKGQQWLTERMMGNTKNPAVFMRSAAFHMKMGLFNMRQLFLQANTLVNAVSIEGRNGLRGGLAYPAARAALFTNNPEIVRSIGKKVEATGLMSSDEFVEAIDLYKKSGFNSIGRDVAFLDDLKGPDIRKSTIGKATQSILDWGSTPFREGERIARMSAWMAAYLSRKASKKGAALTRRDSAAILQRAKDLAGNMTRDSNATWQKGYGSVFTQFFGYQIRIMEQFIGKKLTTAEKLRLFTGYGLVYGLPIAAGATTGFIPIREIVREQMFALGMDPDDSAVEPMIDGFASEALGMILGDDYNTGSFGPGGLPTFYDLIQQDKELSEIFLGASGAIAIQTVKDSWPALRAMLSEWMDYKDGIYNITKDDFIQPLRNISTVDNAIKLWNVYNFGMWASRNEVNITEMDLPDAVLAAMTGIQPQDIEDTFALFRTTKEFRDHKSAVSKEVVKFYRRAMKMDPGPEREVLIRQIKTMMIMEGFTFTEMNRAWQNAFDQESLNEKALERYDDIIRRVRGENVFNEGE